MEEKEEQKTTIGINTIKKLMRANTKYRVSRKAVDVMISEIIEFVAGRTKTAESIANIRNSKTIQDKDLIFKKQS